MSSSSSDPLAALRARIQEASMPAPDDGTLSALLAASDGNTAMAFNLIRDDYNATQAASSSTSRASASSASTLRQRNGGARHPFAFADDDSIDVNDAETYQALLRAQQAALQRNGRRPPPRPHGFTEGGILALLVDAVSLPFQLLHSLLVGAARLLRLPALLASIFPSLRDHEPSDTDSDDEDGQDPRHRSSRHRHGTSRAKGAEFYEMLSTVRSRQGASSSAPISTEDFPPVLEDRYGEALEVTKDSLGILIVALVDCRLDDVRSRASRFSKDEEAFMASLVDKQVISALRQSYPDHLYLWGTCTRSRAGHLVARQLGATRVPQLVCLSLNNPSPYNYSSPQLRIACRLVGNSALSSPERIAQWIEQDCVPRCLPYLKGLKAHRQAMMTERRLREEQDAAYLEAARRDEEKIRQRHAEEDEKRREQEEQARKATSLDEERRKARVWRRWVREELLAQEPSEGASDSTTINAVLPNGKRISRRFLAQGPVEHVFIWLETFCMAGADEEDDDNDDSFADTDMADLYHVEQDAYTLSWGYPRHVLRSADCSKGKTIASVEGLCPRANVIVERKKREGEVAAEEESGSSSESDDDDDA